MRPGKFEYFAPESLEQATKLLAESDGQGRVLAGGQSLMPALNLRLAKPNRLVDLRKVPGLDGIRIQPDRVEIGAMTRHAEIIGSDALHEKVSLFRMAGRFIAHSTIREHGTFGGSLALADPAAEWPAILSLLGGRVRAASVRGERWIPASEFFVSIYTTALAEDEILTSVEIPLPSATMTYGFTEFSRQKGAFALALVAVSMAHAADKRPADVNACLGGCTSKPQLIALGTPSGTKTMDSCIEQAFDALKIAPPDDIHASGEDRLQIAKTLLKRCVAATASAVSQRSH